MSSSQTDNEDMLQDSAQTLRAVWEFAADAMALSDPNGVLTAANPSYFELYGYSAEEVVGQSFAIIFPEDQRELALQQYKETFANPDTPPAVESTIRRKDGSTCIVEVKYTFLMEDGRRKAMLSLIRDITQRKQDQALLDAERLRIAAIIEATTEGIFGMDKNGKCTFINPAALALLGYSASECFGRNMHELIHYKHPDGSPYPVEQCPIYRVLYDGIPRRLVEETLWRKDGTPLPAFYTCAPKHEGDKVVGGVVTIVDISERRKAEEERAELLAREQEARALAEQAIRVQHELLLVVSHDLRSPTTVIKAISQLLQRRIERGNTLDPEQLTGDLVKITQAADRIDSFIQDLSDSSQLQQWQPLTITPEPVDLVALVQRVAASHQQRTHQHKLVVEAQSSEVIGYWDPARLEQVFDNLISNAVKYSPQGGLIRIDVGIEESTTSEATGNTPGGETGSERAVVTVQDQGMGIPSQDLPYVFEWYRRGENVRDIIDGTGVGLAGARHIVEQHGGQIKVESQEGIGSTFTLVLPLHSSINTTGQEV
jgi:PAS domain S-box-containing protein